MVNITYRIGDTEPGFSGTKMDWLNIYQLYGANIMAKPKKVTPADMERFVEGKDHPFRTVKITPKKKAKGKKK
jgi:hypothetical protein